MKRDIFQAIADPTRRAIIVLIAGHAMTPNALADHFEVSRQAISKHIQILNECGLLDQEKAGREIHYQLKLEKMQEIDMWLEQFRKLWETRYSQLDSLLATLKEEKSHEA
ncbi:ArsR/SmtB family transcription factor [Gimibacter soli]|uniref:Metalloregulator ArsR/SmtB family transcription factor n=1 Tax=Gimibacter soli TaxID=3024400 RepID=A0AAF0BI28_9PROT|nr:metalloregulator ArsR/SmtB family transcription factor [Gimibacter soli]WCL54868.1 metalloregulator ArsR/SmtB family transcription factor [Gimibacter soli]